MAMKKPEELPEIKKKKTNPDRINMTYKEAVEDNKRMKELEAKKEALDREFEEDVNKKKVTRKKKIEQIETTEEA